MVFAYLGHGPRSPENYRQRPLRSMRFAGVLHGAGLAGLLAVSAVAQADIANGFAEFLHDVNAKFQVDSFPPGFTVAENGSVGEGVLWSNAYHGAHDFKLFPTTPAYDKSTASNGDFENSHNRVKYEFLPNFPTYVSVSAGTQSDSQAASGEFKLHYSESYARTSVLQKLGVTRSGAGIADPPIFGVLIRADADAVHLKARKEGNAHAISSVSVNLIGTIKNNKVAGAPAENLLGKQVLSKRITANDEWFSPLINQSMWLDLPDWTRLSGADFDLNLGLELRMVTYAEVVPEPGTLGALCLGLFALRASRKRCRKG